MAHLLGVASNPTDLVDQIRTWLLTRGWTTDRWQAWTGGYDLIMHKGGTYIMFRSYYSGNIPWYGVNNLGSGVCMGMFTSYDSARDTMDQLGGPRADTNNQSLGVCANLGAGPYASHQFFDDEDGNYLLTVERTPGVWRHFCWGDSLDKSGAGSWIGGMYFSGHSNGQWASNAVENGAALSNFPPMGNMWDNTGLRAYIRANVDTFQDKWLGLTNTKTTTTQADARLYMTGKNACAAHECDWACNWSDVPKYADYFTGRLFNVQDQRSVLMPLQVFAARDGGGSSLLGTVPSIAISNTVLETGQDLVVGTEVWRQFPGFFVKVVGS